MTDERIHDGAAAGGFVLVPATPPLFRRSHTFPYPEALTAVGQVFPEGLPLATKPF